MYKTCVKGHIFNPGLSEKCPRCRYGEPRKEPTPEKDFNPQMIRDITQGVGGGPKPKERVCSKCGFIGIAKRNLGGNSANCAKCNHRIY